MKTNINNDDASKVSKHDNNKISKILVPIDASSSRKAADYAVFLSSKLGTELCVIHLIDTLRTQRCVRMDFMILRHPMK